MNSPTIFISYSHQDKDWVRNWFLPHFETNGFQTHIDYRDFEIGVPAILNMERAVEKCAKTILVLSQHWCDSHWTQFEGFMLQTEDPINLEKKIIPLMLTDCTLPKRLKMFTYADFREQTEWGFQLQRLKSQLKKDLAVEPTTKPVFAPPDKIDITRLPQTGYELFGRQSELARLNEAWESGNKHVLAFVAYGGTGKSTLVTKWVEKMRWDNYRGAKRVFAWSFYSQGTGEKVTSADLFIKEALIWFDDPQPEQGSPWDKGKRLAELVRREKTLLILDGLEPLQAYSDVEKGKIKDPALAVLVTELAKNNNGLCVITTREPVPELDRYPQTTQTIQLDQISDEAGRALLRVRGIRGTDAELEAITRAFGNHALAINLLAEYLHLFPGHPCQKALEIPDLDVPVEKGKHPRRVMEAFVKYFGEGAELELLCILGLFDRPADQAAIDAILQGDSIHGLTEHLKNLSEKQWAELLERLRTTKLLARKSAHRPNTFDCHPLVREHFGERLRRKEQSAWRIAHERLYEYYKSLPKKELPDTLEEMEPLFAAVAHGCQAGKHREVLDNIFFKRIRRENEVYTFHKLGAFGADLSAMSNFFDPVWQKPTTETAIISKAVLLSWAGFGLRALGRLREAAQPMQAGLEMRIKQENWKGAAINAGNLSELFLTLGDVAAAVSYSRQSVDFADRSGDAFWKMANRTTLADAQHQAGELAAAAALFQEAESLQAKRQPEYRYLYSLQGFRYCDLLLSQGQVREVLERAEKALDIVLHGSKRLLDIAFNKLSLGRAYLLQAAEQLTVTSKVTVNLKQAADYLNQAVTGLREAGTQHHLPQALFARTFLYRLQHDFPRAWEDLAEAQELAERGSMKLWLVDYHLEAARIINCQLRIDNYQLMENGREVVLNREEMLARLKKHVEQAAALVQETGYHRRDPEVEMGYASLFFAQKEPAKAREHLAKAKALLEKMGIRMWDWEVRELERESGSVGEGEI